MEVNASNTNPSVYQAAKVNTDESKSKNTEADIKTTDPGKTKGDSFVKSPEYKMDADKVNTMKTELSNNMAAFRMMVQSLINKQGDFANNALGKLNIDQATQDAAKAAISEDGEWGVKATAKRILDFAKALTGGDPSKIDLMRDSFKKGYAEAERIWGGMLPEICKQTYDAVMKGFDDWENGN